MKLLLRTLYLEDDGQDMVEYSLLFAFIVVCAMAVMTSIRTQMTTTWSTITSAIGSAISNATGS
jgi:Flp pilus assembly pilin Flp